MISADELESWRETLDIMSNKRLVKELQQSEAEFKKGDYLTEKDLLNKLTK